MCDLAALLESVFRSRFARSGYANGRTDYYDVSVKPGESGLDFDLHVTFRAGERYCCTESGCQFGLWDAQAWASINKDLERVGVSAAEPLTIRLHVHVQNGALTGLRFPGDTRELRPTSEFSYHDGPFMSRHSVVIRR